MRILFVLLIGSLLTSCVDLEKSAQTEKIEAMNTTLDSIENVLNENVFDSLSSIQVNSYDVESRIKKHYVSDTINIELGRKMDAFKKMRKSLAPLGKARRAIESGIEEERISLKELLSDIEGSNGERAKYDENILYEKVKVNQLVALLTDYVLTKASASDTYEQHYEDLNEFSLNLLPKNQE
mgnify:FL=1